MPAAAVIPAPIVYVNVAALKKSVAGFLIAGASDSCGPHGSLVSLSPA